MLPSIDLQLTDTSALNGKSGTTLEGVADTDSMTEDFAGLLYQPLPAPGHELAPGKGQGLPDVGNPLPPDGVSSSPVSELIAQSTESRQTELPLFGATEASGLRTPAMNETSPFQSQTPVHLQTAYELQTATRLQGSNQSQAASQLQVSIQANSQSPVLAADPIAQSVLSASVLAKDDILQSKPATGDSILTLKEAQVRRTTGLATKMSRAELLDSSNMPARTLRAPVLDTASASRPPVPAVLPAPLAGMADRLQLSSQAQPIDVAPLTAVPTAPQVAASHLIPTPATSTPPAPIDIPLHDPAWGDALGDRVVFMSGQKIHQAEIRLNPAEMGPISIRISVNDGAADVTFTAQHLAAREAIELAMPRLRELLGENGLALGNASVEEQGVDQDRDGPEAQEAAEENSVAAGESSLDDGVLPQAPARLGQGLVDTFV